MSIKHSIAIGILLMVTVLIALTITFYLSQGPCPTGSFPCDNFTKCVLQRQICDKTLYCNDMYDEDALECGLVHGSTDFTTNVYKKAHHIGSRNHECELDFIPSKSSNCRCRSTAVICQNLNLTSIPHIPPQVTSLFLIGNRLQLTSDSLNELNLTQNLYMKNCRISILPENIFINQKHLRRLYLNHNLLKYVANGSLNGLDSLEWLFLDYNQITNIQLDDLEQLASLQMLNLSHNFLSFSENERFPNMRNIYELHLEHNIIRLITELLFSSLHHLHYLCLDFNLITAIHMNAFDGLKNLREM
ncbi:Relaxin receptor 2, partial [Pseudolycoriella hygida]